MPIITTHNIVKQTDKLITEIEALYDNLKSDIDVMSKAQITSQIRKIYNRITKINISRLYKQVDKIKGYPLYNPLKSKIEGFEKTIDEIKQYLQSIQHTDEDDDEMDVEEFVNTPEAKKANLIKDKYRFLEKTVDSSNTETAIKDTKRLENLIARLNFEDLPEGEYEEMVEIKNNVANYLKTLLGVEKSEKYGPYIEAPLSELIAHHFFMGNKEKAANRTATVLDFIEDPDRISMFEPAIKRMIARKMTAKEFKTFYTSVMDMIKGERKFESFGKYKNRFDEELFRFI